MSPNEPSNSAILHRIEELFQLLFGLLGKGMDVFPHSHSRTKFHSSVANFTRLMAEAKLTADELADACSRAGFRISKQAIREAMAGHQGFRKENRQAVARILSQILNRHIDEGALPKARKPGEKTPGQ